MDRDAIRREAFEEVAKLCEHYGEINFEICGDGILMDPLLHGKGFTEENIKLSDECSTMSTIHSAKYHACIELAEQIRALK
jgi:hypothetical protein